jgi:hypothetical protein
MITFLFFFVVWLPVAILLRAVVLASDKNYFSNKPKLVLYTILAAPALYANWLIALLSKNNSIVEKLEKVGDWFRN